MAPGTQAQVAPGGEPAAGVGRVRKRLLVLSGKGGVGKSTVAANLAMGFAFRGLAAGLLDADLHGPAVPWLLGLDRLALRTAGQVLLPAEMGGLKVMSMGFLPQAGPAAPWRATTGAAVLEQLVRQVLWKALDVLVVDCPAGTGEAHLAVIRSLERVDGAVVVTTPQELALLAARNATAFCRRAGVPVLGILENLSGFQCPACLAEAALAQAGGGRRLAAELRVPFLGALPVDPEVAAAGETGQPILYRELGFGAQKAFQPVLRRLQDWVAARS